MHEKNHFFIYLSCKDSIDTNPANSSYKFNVQLPEIIRIKGIWEVALTELKYLLDFTVQTSPSFC